MGSSGNCRTIVWFRRDLRIEDNPALASAAKDGPVFAVFIWCPPEEHQFYPGRVSRWWLKQSLIHLGHSLKSLGVDLVFMRAQTTLSALMECIRAVGATKVVYNQLYDPVSLVRDHDVKRKIGELGVPVQTFNADLLYEPWDVYGDDGYAFTTFDAYWDRCLHMNRDPVLHLPPSRLVPATGSVEGCAIDELGLEDESEKPSNALLGRAWSPGWVNADKALTTFVEHHLLDYARDGPKVARNSTSILSPHIHFGEVSIRKVFHVVATKRVLWAADGRRSGGGERSVERFLRVLGLREYSRYLCFNFPFSHERPLLRRLRGFPWEADEGRFKAWRQGRTGFPLVDAGMRELWATGWLHNKIRVVAASFFVKCLLLPWQWGMKYFWDTLLDADLESDILGWQYISGSLPDGHELQRLDSPEVQGFKYDPDGEYVRQWLPELARMPTEWIHHPWNAPPAVLQSAGVDLGSNYPDPIVDIEHARDRLAAAVRRMRERESAAHEVVSDNCADYEPSGAPRVRVRTTEAAPPPPPSASASSNDQKVPSMVLHSGDGRKRSKPPTEETDGHDDEGSEVSKTDDDLRSTAVSSTTTSENKRRAAGTDGFRSSVLTLK